jgi:hypothetical protein
MSRGEGGGGSRWGQDMKYTGPVPIVIAPALRWYSAEGRYWRGPTLVSISSYLTNFPISTPPQLLYSTFVSSFYEQRVFYRSWRARLSRRRKIWLLTPSSPPSPVSKFDQRRTGRLRKRENLLMGERGREGGRRPIIRRWESLVLYATLNTLCLLSFHLYV